MEKTKKKFDLKKITKSAKSGIKSIKKEGKKIKIELNKTIDNINNFDPLGDFEMPNFEQDLNLDLGDFDLGLNEPNEKKWRKKKHG